MSGRNTVVREPEQNSHQRQKDVDTEEVTDSDRTMVMSTQTRQVARTPRPAALARLDTSLVSKKLQALSEKENGPVARLQAEFLHACLPLFFAEQDPVQCLGLTSAIAGEGKTLAALLVSHALATSSRRPVVLVECDWQRPTLSRDLDLSNAPGLAEWLCGANSRADIRHQFVPNLTVVPAGHGGPDAMTALAELQRQELYDRLADPDELMILDLPSILDSYYGTIAARSANALLLVVRAGATPSSLVAQACDKLKHLRVEGIILNQMKTRIPQWLQHLL